MGSPHMLYFHAFQISAFYFKNLWDSLFDSLELPLNKILLFSSQKLTISSEIL